MTPDTHKFTRHEGVWWIAMLFFLVICLADYHYSTSNQIPSDGPLRIGFPMTSYWMWCPMISAGAGACHRGFSALGLIVDLIACMGFAIIAAILMAHFARKNFVKSKGFWITTCVVFASIFLIASAVAAFHATPHHGRALEIGWPAVYLREYAGESWKPLNLSVDLVVCFLAAFFGVASICGERWMDR